MPVRLVILDKCEIACVEWMFITYLQRKVRSRYKSNDEHTKSKWYTDQYNLYNRTTSTNSMTINIKN